MYGIHTYTRTWYRIGQATQATPAACESAVGNGMKWFTHAPHTPYINTPSMSIHHTIPLTLVVPTCPLAKIAQPMAPRCRHRPCKVPETSKGAGLYKHFGRLAWSRGPGAGYSGCGVRAVAPYTVHGPLGQSTARAARYMEMACTFQHAVPAPAHHAWPWLRCGRLLSRVPYFSRHFVIKLNLWRLGWRRARCSARASLFCIWPDDNCNRELYS